jgi:hypothetical protein
MTPAAFATAFTLMEFLTSLRQKERVVSEDTLVIVPPTFARCRAEYSLIRPRAYYLMLKLKGCLFENEDRWTSAPTVSGIRHSTNRRSK